ncbi:hypothetical protein ACFUCV_10345 [Specibacter sp. NPDC057265]|uniref:hypothetical protein n=1 Tax=Specibacter sp. NPDC057265 TaxID=3346075 RepID=UPI00362C5FF5
MTTSPVTAGLRRTITLKTTNAALASLELEAAVAQVEQHAIEEKRHGVLVTRHDHGTFTIETSPLVPYGQTHEHRS